MDNNYQTYLNRVARMTLPETYNSQVQHIQQSPKFQERLEGGIQAVPFPGYTILTPPAEEEEPQNFAFYQNLHECQQQLLQLPLDNVIIPVPPASFHLTLADLIWDDAFRYASKDSEFEVHLRYAISQIFQQCQESMTQTSAISWQILGLIVMPRAVGVCLVPKDENSYEQILKLRRTLYQNSGLTRLGIEQHYHFTAHISIGYFGESSKLDRDRLASNLGELNQQWLNNSPEIWLHRAELRKFDDMTCYYREPDWPVLKF